MPRFSAALNGHGDFLLLIFFRDQLGVADLPLNDESDRLQTPSHSQD
jgi:hypothetical protein